MAKSSASLLCRPPYQESRWRPKRFAAAASLALVLALGAFPAAAEIETGADRPTPSPSPTRVGDGGSAGSLAGDVRARCWQHGSQIFDVADFASAAVPPELREQAVSLKASGRTAVLLPFADTFCLLTVSP